MATLHSAAAAVISQQPHPGQELWYHQQHHRSLAGTAAQGRPGTAAVVAEEERRRKERTVLFVVVLSVATFVRRILMLALGLLRLSYRKVAKRPEFADEIILQIGWLVEAMTSLAHAIPQSKRINQDFLCPLSINGGVESRLLARLCLL